MQFIIEIDIGSYDDLQYNSKNLFSVYPELVDPISLWIWVVLGRLNALRHVWRSGMKYVLV